MAIKYMYLFEFFMFVPKYIIASYKNYSKMNKCVIKKNFAYLKNKKSLIKNYEEKKYINRDFYI